MFSLSAEYSTSAEKEANYRLGNMEALCAQQSVGRRK